MDRFESMRLLVRVVERQSFTAAASDLGMTPISVLYPKSRQVSPRVRVFIDWLVEAVAPKL